MNKQSAFLLSYLKYGDNDAVVHCFTRENGFQSFFVRGIYSAKNKKKAYLMPLNEFLITTADKFQNSKLPVITKIDPINTPSLDYDIKTSSVHFFIADFLNQVLKNEHKNEAFYEEIRVLIMMTKEKKFYCHYIFVLKILKFFGICPSLSEGVFLNVEKGEFQSFKENQTLDEDVSLLWKDILENDFSYNLILKKDIRKRFLDSIMLYYRNHFPDFYTPKSLSILTEIFE